MVTAKKLYVLVNLSFLRQIIPKRKDKEQHISVVKETSEAKYSLTTEKKQVTINSST
jgi:hypothetical protein